MPSHQTMVAIDGGAASDSALAWGLQWSRDSSTPLALIAVVEPRWQANLSPELALAHVKGLQAALERAASLASGVEATTSLLFGEIADELVNNARYAEVLVVGSNKPAALPGVIHGTVPLKVADDARVPVVVVPVGWTPAGGSVVVGVDHETDDTALDFAARAAGFFATDLVLVHAWNTAPLVFADTEQYAELTAELEAAGRELLDGTLRSLAPRHPSLSISTRLEFADPSVAMVEAARGARLAVVGTHRRHALAGLLLGSVGHDLLMNLPCPVAIAPPAPVRDTP